MLAGADAGHLAPVATRPWSGLETQIGLETPPAAAQVRALDASGRVLGRSAVVTP